MITLPNLQDILREQLPGAPAQSRMGIDSRSRRESKPRDDRPRVSAVLILIYPQDEQLWLPLTLRTNRVVDHRGQISLPGGQYEKGDTTVCGRPHYAKHMKK